MAHYYCKCKAIARCTLFAALYVSLILWLRGGILPYPISYYLAETKITRYSAKMIISEKDYLDALHIAQEQLKWPEVIINIDIPNATCVKFTTLYRLRGPLDAFGRSYQIEYIKGKWQVTTLGCWGT